ncbi:unnamed protein product [Polarella glacialis]|uniref:Uncharacterized protein n=1 Tax=Polarella glacialis TaxID=89957 RepID=A0A813GY45_POLGL|nr:unnamed protein product [Polarella glacialis]
MPQRRAAPLLYKLRAVFLPASGVFLVILLSTLANFLSFEVWIALGPADLLFTVPFAWCLQGVRAKPQELVAVALASAGSLAFASGKLSGAAAADSSSVALAIVVTLLCRACQSLQTVLLRNACRQLGAGSGGGKPSIGEKLLEESSPFLQTSVLEIAALKMWMVAAFSLPYALATEGAGPWREMAAGNFWSSGPKGALLTGSCVITLLFQLCNVGMNAEASSLTVAMVTTALAPLTGLALALTLGSGGQAGRSLAALLGLKASELTLTGIEVFGLILLGVAVVLYFLGQRARLREARSSTRSSAGSGVEFQRDPAPAM